MIRAAVLSAVLSAALAVSPGAAFAAAYAVVVGIDDYASHSNLAGAVNDAEDLAAALDRRGADVILLKDSEATRSNIVGALRKQIGRAEAGDVVVFTYAGHGLQIDEQLIGDEDDGKDENFILHGFTKSGPGAGERLRDNDIAFLFGSARPGVSFLFVADSCHSGTMTRGPIAGGALGLTRVLDEDIGTIDDDPLPPPDASTFQVEIADIGDVVFAAAARDDQTTPEVEIDGASRGALSWSIARALDGFADGGDGLTSLAELREYVRAEVRGYSGVRQTPDVEFDRGAGEGVLALLNGDAFTLQERAESVETAPLAPIGKPRLHIRGIDLGEGGAAPEIAEEDRAMLANEAEITDDIEAADLVWSPYDGRLIDRLAADLLATSLDAADAAAAIAKWRAVGGLVRWSPRRAFDLRVSDGDRRYTEGDLVSFVAHGPEAGPSAGVLTLINLASGGEVQYIYPGPKTAAAGRDIVQRGRELTIGPAPVQPPFGADHLIGVITATDAAPLRDKLRALNGQRATGAVLEILREHAADPAVARVAVLPVFSAELGE